MAHDPTHHCEDRPWNDRAILHVDLDAFFAAVEQLDHPEWRGRPVIVGGDPSRRGVVSTCSYEARRFGVRSAMSSARAAVLCPDAVWAPPRFARYREISRAVFEIFISESPRVQPVSIDEAFLDVTPGRRNAEHPVAVARRIRSRIAELGITASVGVATSKTVAKIGSDHDKPDGLTIVCPGDEAAFLGPLPVRAMGGIGPKTADRLSRLGIHTLADLGRLDDMTAEEVLGSGGPTLAARARGVDARPVRTNEPAKQVSKERTFPHDVRTRAEIANELARLSAEVGRRLRKDALTGRTVTVKMRFTDFTTKTAQRTLSESTDDERVFGPVAESLALSLWTPGVGVRLLGVGMSGFDTAAAQLSLDDERTVSLERSQGLVKGVDAVRERFGDDALRFGREVMRDRRRLDTRPEDETDADSKDG